jgi:thymidylate synthase (FAD)
MRLIKPSFEILEQKPGLDGLLQHIERCGRTCYKSEDKITEDSAEKFVNMLVNRGHTAMVEHGTVYLTLGMPDRWAYFKYCTNKYSEAISEGEAEKGTWVGYVTTNYRVLLQNDWLDDLQYLTEPTKHIRRVTVKFVCDRGVSHEFVRHRVFSFAQESTRYCNYNKDKFGNECTFIIPSWLDYEEQQFTDKNDSSCSIRTDLSEHEYFIDLLLEAERTYNFLVQYCGWKPQQARAVLPNSLKTELIMTGTIEQWEGFFKLRDANDAHPQARELAAPLHEEFIRRGLLQ